MRATSSHSLRGKLLVLAMATSTVALVLSTFAFSTYEYFVVRAEAIRNLESEAGILAANVGAAAAFDDTEHAQLVLQSLKLRSEFEAAGVFNERREVLAKYQRIPSSRQYVLPDKPPPAGVQWRGAILFVWQPITYKDSRIGFVYLESSFSPIVTRFIQYLGLALIVLTASWLIALWLASRLQKRISAPIVELSRTAREITQRKDYTVRAVKQGDDEIGQLADGFNEMLAQIQTHDSALQAAHDGLERRVGERTQELEKEIVVRRRVEEALGDEKERLSVTLRAIGDAVITTDTDGRIVLFNPVAEMLTGVASSDACGCKLGDVLKIVDERTRLPAEDPVTRILCTEGPVDLGEKILLNTPHVEEPIVEYSGACIRDLVGRLVGVVLVFRDVTEKHHTAQELLRAGKIETIGLLAGGIAHDFNNILTAVIGNISMARMDAPPGSELAVTLAAAETAAIRAGDLTRQLLTFSKGGAPIKKTASLGELIRETTNFILHGTKVACQFAIADGLWSAEVDAGQISQVIHNIVLNAVQAMPNGGLLHVSAHNAMTDRIGGLSIPTGRYVAISIQDSGPGIPAEKIQRIFEPYFTTKKHGTGLGLATSYSIIKRHDGFINAESTPGEGTTFHIHLPATTVRPTEPTPARLTHAGQGRVLVMDDEPQILHLASAMLARLGYEAETVSDGETAVRAYRTALDTGSPYLAVILDLTIPGAQGGKETMRQLLEIDPAVKTIVSSGYSEDPIMAHYRTHGFGGILPKPYDIESLSSALHELLAPRPR